MRVGIATEETWAFLHEFAEELRTRHRTTVFKRPSYTLPLLNSRVNQRLLCKELRSFMYVNDVVFFEWASELLATATHLPKTCGIVTRLHRYEMYQWAHRINWQAVDVIILVSKAKRQEFLARFPDQAHKVIVIPEAVSLSRFRLRPRAFQGNIGTLCHLRPRKRVYDLILAFYELAQERDNLHLHIGGGKAASFDEYYVSLHRLVEKLDLHPRVTFYGNVSEPESWYGQIDIFVSNSYSEGLQVTPMEAMACGCYCLCHHWDGADELLPEDNLFYTSRELQDKILRYCDLTETERQAEQARMRALAAQRFDVDQTKVRFRQVIEEVAARARNGSSPPR